MSKRYSDMTEAELDAHIATRRSEHERLMKEHADFAASHGDLDNWDDGATTRYGSIDVAITKVDDELRVLEVRRAELREARLAERAEKVETIRRAALSSSNVERLPGSEPRSRGDNYHDRAARVLDANHRSGAISADLAESVTHLLSLPGQRSVDMSAWVEAAGSLDYLNAFAKRMADPLSGHLTWTAAEAEAHRNADTYARAALSLSGASSMLPLALDPTIALTNTGSTGGIRSVCRHETIAAASWSGVTSAGASAEWKVENAQAADGTPAVAGKNIPVYLLDVDAMVSYEIEMDGVNLAHQLGLVIQDAATVAVDAALATGSGSGAPTGIMTALTATQDIVTGGAFAAANVYSLQNALPPRFQKNSKFVAPLPVINQVAQFTTTNGSLYFQEVRDNQLLRRGLVEDSNLSTDMATSGSRFAVVGDWNQYLMVTRTGASIEILPNYGANGRPTASRHYFLTLRLGADALVPNAFRVLKKS